MSRTNRKLRHSIRERGLNDMRAYYGDAMCHLGMEFRFWRRDVLPLKGHTELRTSRPPDSAQHEVQTWRSSRRVFVAVARRKGVLVRLNLLRQPCVRSCLGSLGLFMFRRHKRLRSSHSCFRRVRRSAKQHWRRSWQPQEDSSGNTAVWDASLVQWSSLHRRFLLLLDLG